MWIFGFSSCSSQKGNSSTDGPGVTDLVKSWVFHRQEVWSPTPRSSQPAENATSGDRWIDHMLGATARCTKLDSKWKSQKPQKECCYLVLINEFLLHKQTHPQAVKWSKTPNRRSHPRMIFIQVEKHEFFTSKKSWGNPFAFGSFLQCKGLMVVQIRVSLQDSHVWWQENHTYQLDS